MRYFFIFFIFCIALGLTNNHAHAMELDELLQNMAKHSAKTNTLQAKFTQEKKLSFLQKPLKSTGHFFFTKDYSKNPALLWEYLAPAPSGILFKNNQSWLWIEERTTLKKAEGFEGNVLSTMISQMLLWFVFEPTTLKSNYDISINSNHTNKGLDCIKLVPKDNSFFSSMQLCMDNYTIKTMLFNEPQGDSTNLLFEDIQINTKFPTAFLDGTPFP